MQASVVPARPILSICIPSLASRSERLFTLVRAIQAQDRANEVEILMAVDAGGVTTGEKRTALVQQARGSYVCHVDDDDEVAPDFIPKVLAAIESHVGVDAIVLRGRRTHPGGKAVEYDYRVDGIDGEYDADGVLWRTPNHLCPIRADIAKAVPFPARSHGEDLAWGQAVKPLLRTEARAGRPGEVLYHYRWDPWKKRSKSHAEIFAPQYTRWSGPGSTSSFSAPYRAFLERFIGENGIRSVLDLGCGDFEIMSLVDRQRATYHGVDVIPARIELDRAKDVIFLSDARRPGCCGRETFEPHDIQTYDIPPVDLVICKDVLQHWCTAEVRAFLERLKTAQIRYALLTNCAYPPSINSEIATGGWRALDLTAAPFCVGDVVFQWERKDVVLLYGAVPAPVTP